MKLEKNTTPSGPSRRTVVKGAAWAVPAITVASAVPAYAISGEITFEFLAARKIPGNSCLSDTGVSKGYSVKYQVCSTLPEDATVSFTTGTGTINGESRTWDVEPNSVLVPSNGCVTVYIGLSDQNNSSQAELIGEAPYTWSSATGSGSGIAYFSAATTPPITGNNCRF